MAMCNFVKSNPNCSCYSSKVNTCNIPESSTSSCTELYIDRCAARCGNRHCQSCCCNMINDHTYCMLKRLCRKIIRDYSRQQCREKYTVFDGGNSVNVRIHRSSSMGQALSDGKIGRQNSSPNGRDSGRSGGKYGAASSEAMTDRQRRKNSSRGRDLSEQDNARGKSRGGRAGDKDTTNDGTGGSARGGGTAGGTSGGGATSGKAKKGKRGEKDDQDGDVDGGGKQASKANSKARRGDKDDNNEDASSAKKGKSNKSDRQADDRDNDDSRKSKSGKGAKSTKSGQNGGDEDDLAAGARFKSKGKGRTSNANLPVISDLREKVRKGEDISVSQKGKGGKQDTIDSRHSMADDDRKHLKKSKTKASISGTGRKSRGSTSRIRRVKSLTSRDGKNRRSSKKTQKRGSLSSRDDYKGCGIGVYRRTLSRPSRYDEAGISDVLRAKMEQRELCCQPVCCYDPCRPCVPCTPYPCSNGPYIC